MAKTYNRLDIEVNEKNITDIVTAVQNDTLSRYLDVTLFNNGIPMNLTGHIARIYMIKPDGKEIFNNGEITDAVNGRVQFELTSQALAVCGNLQTQIIIFDNQEREILSTNIFNIFITKSLKNESSIESSNEYGALVILFQNIYEALQLMTEVVQKLGLPTEKLEELNLTTMYETLSYLINMVEENSTVAVQDKLKEIENKIEELENYTKDKDISYLDLPNLNYNNLGLNNLITDTNYKTAINITGSGYLVAALLKYSVNNTQKNIKGIKITLDNKIIYWQEVNVTNAKYSSGLCAMGISNAQNSYSGSSPKTAQYLTPLAQTYSQENLKEVLRLSHFSNNKVTINSPEITFSSLDTSKVIFNKGLRFENSLRIEIVSDLTNKSVNLYYLYSLDN